MYGRVDVTCTGGRRERKEGGASAESRRRLSREAHFLSGKTCKIPGHGTVAALVAQGWANTLHKMTLPVTG